MLTFLQGNLLEAPVDALVNTVNTVGVMGKGIALMFKEAFPENFSAYAEACKNGEITVGRMFVTERHALGGPRWLINFPTKKHWRQPSKLQWVMEGLKDLQRVIQEKQIRSIALPPLGCGNGGLNWADVKREIEEALGALDGVDVLVYEPTPKYQNVAKKTGKESLTPARALVAAMVRRYWVLALQCTNLEVQKLGWFLERTIERMGMEDPLRLKFTPNKYGPYSEPLRHLLNELDGSYLHSSKRLSDAGPLDEIWFEEERKEFLELYLKQPENRQLLDVLNRTGELIDGFESTMGMELLSTVDWLIEHEGCQPTVSKIREGLARWPGGPGAAERKLRLFDDRSIQIALNRLTGLVQVASVTITNMA